MQVAAPILMDLAVRQVIRYPFGTLRALYQGTQLGPRELAVDHASGIRRGTAVFDPLCHPLHDPARRCLLSRSEGLFCALSFFYALSSGLGDRLAETTQFFAASS